MLAFFRRCFVSSCALAALVGLSPLAHATERHFTYTYETGVLNPGTTELETWNTFRTGRRNYFNGFDQRLELEFGIVPGLQSSLYLNYSAAGFDQIDGTGTKQRLTAFEFEGVSSEWKYQLSNPVADALGSALYFEARLAPVEAELEGKLILDKRAGRLLGAVNFVGEYEWNFAEPGNTKREAELELDVGAAYFLTEELTLGAELRNVNELEDADELESSVICGGPVFAAIKDRWWVAISVMPQLLALKGSSPGSRLELQNNERVQTRALLGFHL